MNETKVGENMWKYLLRVVLMFCLTFVNVVVLADPGDTDNAGGKKPVGVCMGNVNDLPEFVFEGRLLNGGFTMNFVAYSWK